MSITQEQIDGWRKNVEHSIAVLGMFLSTDTQLALLNLAERGLAADTKVREAELRGFEQAIAHIERTGQPPVRLQIFIADDMRTELARRRAESGA